MRRNVATATRVGCDDMPDGMPSYVFILSFLLLVLFCFLGGERVRGFGMWGGTLQTPRGDVWVVFCFPLFFSILFSIQLRV